MTDITKFCKQELEEVKTQKFESEGRVMFCLRKHFAAKVTASSTASSVHVVDWLVFDTLFKCSWGQAAGYQPRPQAGG